MPNTHPLSPCHYNCRTALPERFMLPLTLIVDKCSAHTHVANRMPLKLVSQCRVMLNKYLRFLSWAKAKACSTLPLQFPSGAEPLLPTVVVCLCLASLSCSASTLSSILPQTDSQQAFASAAFHPNYSLPSLTTTLSL